MDHSEIDFEVIETDKLGAEWRQGLAVVRRNLVYLRLVGDGTNYRVMTATAGEDFGGYAACQDKERLWKAALQLASSHGTDGDPSEDRKDRKYVRIFELSQDEGASDEQFSEALMILFGEFFKIYDALENEAT